MSHQHMDEASDSPGENPFYKTTNEASISKNTSTDHGTIREDGLSYHIEKKPCLNHETAHELKNQDAYTVDNKKENFGDVSDENVKEKVSISDNTSIDHGTNRANGLFYHGEKKPCLSNEIAHQLKNRNVYTADSKEENACNASNEHVKEDEVSHGAKSGHICSVCRRDFKSMKLLAGHMRCHPKRSWRGIQPPCVSSTKTEYGGQKMDDQNDSATTMESSPSNRLSPLVRWPVKKNRYMVPDHNLKVPNSLENKNYEENKVAGNPFKPPCEDSVEQEQGRKKQVCEELEANSMNSKLEKSRLREQKNKYENGFRSEFTKSDYKTETIRSSEKMDNIKYQMQIPYRTEKKRKLTSNTSHICRTSNKSFNSHHALGGHMTGHKKDSMSATKVDAILTACSIEDVRDESLNEAQSKPLPDIDAPCSYRETVLRCTICIKTFPSRQALVGHQRCHWSSGLEDSMTLIKLWEDENRDRRQILKFDLNELAMAEAENDLELTLGLELKLGSSTI